MRRTPAVALVGLLLGLSGCAGVPQRLSWSSSATDRSDPTDNTTPSPLAWWRRPRTENSSSDQTAKVAETSETAQPAASNKLPNDVWPESRDEWLARRFPFLSKCLNGPTVSAADYDARNRELNNRLLAPWLTPAPAAGSRRDDVDVRPVDATASNDEASSDRQTIPGQSTERTPPMLGTPLVVKSRPHSLPETSGDVALDVNHVEPTRASRFDPYTAALAAAQPLPASSSSDDSASVMAALTGERQASDAPSSGQTDAAADSAQPKQASSSTVDAVTDSAQPTQASSPPVDSASVLAKSAGDDRSSEPPANSQPDAALEPTTAPNPTVGPETLLAQAPAAPAPNTQPPSSIPPPPPPVGQTPPPAPPAVGDKPAANPTQAETSPPPAPGAAKPTEAEQTTAQPAPAPATPETQPVAPQTPVAPVPATAAPVSTSVAPPAPPYGQRPVAVSKRSPYASPPPMAPPPPRHKFLGLFFVEDAPRPLATPQLPPAMFPASYRVGTPGPAPAQPASQAVVSTPQVACNAPPKPCVLSVLFQKIKGFGNRSGCSGCHHGGTAPCCQGCTCYSGSSKPAQASPQASVATPHGKLAFWQRQPTSQAAPRGSNGTQPGDITEEGKLFERVSFESFDEAIER